MVQDSAHMAAGMPFDYAMKIDCTVADDPPNSDNWIFIAQRMEGQDLQHLKYGTTDAEPITLSWYTKGNKAGTMCVGFRQAGAARGYVSETTLTGDGNWERVSVTVPGDTSGDITNDNTNQLSVRFVLAAGADKNDQTPNAWAAEGDYASANQTNFLDNAANDLWIAGVQLEVGSAATDFEHRTYGEELILCRRYYEQWTYSDTPDQVEFGTAHHQTTTFCHFCWTYKVTKRAAPTITIGYDAANDFRAIHTGGTSAASAITVANPGVNSVRLILTVAAVLTAGHAGQVNLTNNSSNAANLSASAEL
jgi:hypothetical protein